MSLRTRIISIFIFSILIAVGLNVERLAMAQGSRLSLISLPISVYILDDLIFNNRFQRCSNLSSNCSRDWPPFWSGSCAWWWSKTYVSWDKRGGPN